MNRFLIFAAMAPPLGFVVAFWVMLQIANRLAGSPITFDVSQVMMLPTIYLFGLIPALWAAGFDHALAKRNVPYRIAFTALFGYTISYLHAGGGVLGGLCRTGRKSACSASSARCRRRCVLGWRRSGTRPALFRHHERMRSSGRDVGRDGLLKRLPLFLGHHLQPLP